MNEFALADPSFRYTWAIWAAAFLLPWALLYIARPALRRPMLWASALTAPFGLTQPLFVPEYWSPPSQFDLAQRTGFDLESLVFCFAIGGLGVAGYRAMTHVPLPAMDHKAHSLPWHRWHLLALASPFFVFGGGAFLALYTVFLLGLKWIWPGYIEAVWNLDALFAFRPGGLPLEELLFGFAFGMYWSSVYEHLTWRLRDPALRPPIQFPTTHLKARS